MQPAIPLTPHEAALRIQQLERRVDMLERLVLALPHTEPVLSPFVTPTAPFPPSIPEPSDPTWIPVLHRMDRNSPDFPPPCGNVGIFLTKPIQEGERCSRDILRICPPGEREWRAPTLHDEPRCQTCHALIDPFSSADLDYLSVMQPASPPPTWGAPARQRVGENRPDSPPGVGGSEGSPELGPVPVPPPPFAVPTMTPQAGDDVQHDIDALQKLADDILG